MSMRHCLILAAAAFSACGGAPATIEFVEVTPPHPRIGEIATVTFKLTDYRGVAQAGTNVNFRLLAAKPGITLTPAQGTSLKGTGYVSTQIVSTASVTSVTVVADASGGKVALSPPISFAGSVANGRQFTFQCGPFGGAASGGVHALGTYNQARDFIAGTSVDCTAHVGDRNSDGVPGALVSFLTEAGTIGPTETSVADVIGNATILYKTTFPMPKETDPDTFRWNPTNDATHTGQYLVPLWMEPFTWTTNPLATIATGTPAYSTTTFPEPRRKDPVRLINGQRPTNNPRDNLVTMIAVVAGEEGFTDADNNGTYTPGEPFDDLTEPFVDSNDNGTWDPDEKFIDTDGDGQWDGKSGEWDPNTLLWVQERITWTGIPFYSLIPNTPNDYDAPEPTFKPSFDTGTNLTIKCSSAVTLTFLMADPWFNTLASNSDGDGCEQNAATSNVEVKGVSKGRPFTYPAIRGYSFTVGDALQRMPAPMTNPPQPACFPPFPDAMTNPARQQYWAASVRCNFTASPKDGYIVSIIDGAEGSLWNNLPVPCTSNTVQGCGP